MSIGAGSFGEGTTSIQIPSANTGTFAAFSRIGNLKITGESTGPFDGPVSSASTEVLSSSFATMPAPADLYRLKLNAYAPSTCFAVAVDCSIHGVCAFPTDPSPRLPKL